ncbi:hypothetical protein PVAG01_07899 [Phlyctema vagabunda]|uniref:Uncharacterized protein n=1 Tax=Phlyctema vagabunda TaxID=108571 RepID=A0ABR4PDV1_9HELO
MSGSGGYYKYRCKYWLTFNCPHWVWVNNAPCAHCLADGRDSDLNIKSTSTRVSRDIYVPHIKNGTFQYTLMEIIAASDFDSGWLVKDKPLSSSAFPTTTEPSVATKVIAVDGIGARSKGRLKVQQEGAGWTVDGTFRLE